MTCHGIYPSLPAPTGVPWSEYVRSQRNGSRSVSSSTEALDSDHGGYITSRIAQHARSMAIGTRPLPTDSPVPHFQPTERGHMSEGGLSDSSQRVVFPGDRQTSPHTVNVSSGGIKYHCLATEPDTYTGLADDYGTLFEARHGRGTLDPVPMTNREMVTTSSIGTTPTTLSTGMINPITEVGPTYNNRSLHPHQRECVPVDTDLSVVVHRAVTPNSGHIIGEGVTIFTDMTETMLDTLDQQIVLSNEGQKPESSLTDNTVTTGQTRYQMNHDM